MDVQIVLAAWNLMGGLEWEGLPYAVEILGVPDADIETTIHLLTVLRDDGR
jgi:hypothetical protein